MDTVGGDGGTRYLCTESWRSLEATGQCTLLRDVITGCAEEGISSPVARSLS